ncbi:MAG: hypothetical protein V4807_30795 [Burkholderia gladioli]|uniref:hypothetical protein n=1 Tax=Burkholderia gladioli TaxID=28095 RepID=UPI00163F2CB9|nr:hypothetical protein [Burkholderia gladioli]
MSLQEFFTELRDGRFLSRNFNRSPVFFDALNLNPYALSLKNIDELLAAREDWLSEFLEISDDEQIWRSLPRPNRVLQTQLEYVRSQVLQGKLVRLSEQHRLLPEVTALCRQFERCFSGNVGAQIFVSGSMTNGRPRMETSNRFLMPIYGCGSWNVYERVASNPRDWARRVFAVRHDMKKVMTENFVPQSVLYVPGGVPFSLSLDGNLSAWLEISVHSASVSDALNLTISNMSGIDACFNAPLIGNSVHDDSLLDEALKRAQMNLGKTRAAGLASDLTRQRNARLPSVGAGYLWTTRNLDLIDSDSEIIANPHNLVEIVDSGPDLKIFFSSTIDTSNDGGKQPGFLSLPKHVRSEVEHLVHCTSPAKIGSVRGELNAQSKIVLAKELMKIGIINLVSV